MGTAILATQLARGFDQPVFAVSATFLGALAWIFFGVIVVGFARGISRNPEALKTTWQDPAALPFWGAAGVAVQALGQASLRLIPKLSRRPSPSPP